MPSKSKSQSYDVRYNVGYYYFQTDHGLLYSVAFNNLTSKLPPLLGIYDIDVYDIEFFPVDLEPDKSKPFDDRVSATIVDLLERQMHDELQVLIYLFDAANGRPQARQALFSRWHRNMTDTLDHNSVRIQVDDDSVVYGGVFKRKDFPHDDVLRSELIDKASGFILQKFYR